MTFLELMEGIEEYFPNRFMYICQAAEYYITGEKFYNSTMNEKEMREVCPEFVEWILKEGQNSFANDKTFEIFDFQWGHSFQMRFDKKVKLFQTKLRELRKEARNAEKSSN